MWLLWRSGVPIQSNIAGEQERELINSEHVSVSSISMLMLTRLLRICYTQNAIDLTDNFRPSARGVHPGISIWSHAVQVADGGLMRPHRAIGWNPLKVVLSSLDEISQPRGRNVEVRLAKYKSPDPICQSTAAAGLRPREECSHTRTISVESSMALDMCTQAKKFRRSRERLHACAFL